MATSFSVKVRIYGGFLTVLGFLVTVAILVGIGFVVVERNVAAVERETKDTIRVMTIDRSVVGLRRNVLLFTGGQGDVKAIDRIRVLQAELNRDLPEAIAAAGDPERKAALERMKTLLEQYNSNLERIVALRINRDKVLNERAAPAGAAMVDQLMAAKDAVIAEGDYAAAARASTALEHLLLARVSANRFLSTPERKFADVVLAQLGATETALKSLATASPSSRKTTESVGQILTAYAQDFAQIMNDTQDMDRLVSVEAARLATEFGDLATKVREDEVRVLAELGTSSKATIDSQEAWSRNLSILAVLLGLTLAALIARSILRPIDSITEVMHHLSGDNLTVAIPYADRTDEIGTMAKALAHFKDQLLRVKQLEKEQEEQKKRAEAERMMAMRKMADTFEDSVGKVIETVTSAATELQAASGQMAGTATETSAQATTVASAAQEASTNVETVAAATEELAASINEISHQVERSQAVAIRARDEAGNTTVQVRSLSDNVGKIGEIVNLINDIAAQTNLLALNATIEAARAGDAGKGFAVVAGEVKNLANQTARATSEIADQIAAVQQSTTAAVEAIDSISKVIGEMGEISTSVASAVQQQTAATDEIARNVEQASAGTQEVSANIVSVEQAARETGGAAEQIKESASDLSRQAEFLRHEVQSFLAQVRADKKDQVLLRWDGSLDTGIAAVDKHHREIYELVNGVYRKMIGGEGAAAFAPMLAELDRSMRTHFDEEEALMAKHAYPDLEQHRRSHRAFFERIEQARAALTQGRDNAGPELFDFVATWLTNHIRKEDGTVARYLAERRAA